MLKFREFQRYDSLFVVSPIHNTPNRNFGASQDLPEPPRGGLPRKGSRTKSFLPGNASQRFSRLWSGGPTRKGSRRSPQQRLQNKILITRKASRARFLLPGNALQRLWPWGPPRKGTRRRLILPGSAFERLWRGLPPRKSSRTILLLPGDAFQRLWPGSPPRNGSRARSFLPGNAFRGFGQGVPQERL